MSPDVIKQLSIAVSCGAHMFAGGFLRGRTRILSMCMAVYADPAVYAGLFFLTSTAQRPLGCGMEESGEDKRAARLGPRGVTCT